MRKGFGIVQLEMEYFPSQAWQQPSKQQLLGQHLHQWWGRSGQFHFQPPSWPAVMPSDEERVRAIAAEFAQDAQLASMQLCDFLGTPEGEVIAAAVEAVIPAPYGPVVKAALTVTCNRQGAGRQLLVGLVAGVVVAGVLAWATSK